LIVLFDTLFDFHQHIKLTKGTMIRRTTPNKTFSSSRGGSSCCRWNRDEETKV